MKLLYARFSGLPGAERIELDLEDVNVFVGPNGSGKSTALQALRFGLDFLSRKTVSSYIGDVDSWYVFQEAAFIFEGEDGWLDHFSPTLLQFNSEQLELRLKCQDGVIHIDSIASASTSIITDSSPIEDIESNKSEFSETQRRIAEVESQLSTMPQGGEVRNRMKGELSSLENDLVSQIDRYEASVRCELIKSDKSPQEIGREVIDAALSKTPFPRVVWVDSINAIEDAIPVLIQDVCAQQAGRQPQKQLSQKRYEELRHLLQHEVDFFEQDGEKHLTVDGTDYRKASSGTRVSLAYFGLTQLMGANDIVIWDEPENGLHPTRRIRVLDLILRDSRQFFIATHALEFSPVFSSRGKIFRCDSLFDTDSAKTNVSVRHINGRKEGFQLLEALGVQPARTLFTANVVVWVEGPTELIFYRHWLKKILEPRGIEDGFHYTIMHYGGGLISYLDVADDLSVTEAFDALSICRNLIILVDSDLRAEVQGDIRAHLKPGARRVSEEVDRLNGHRPNAAMFSVTAGREIENYLPPKVLLHAASMCWKGYEEYAAQIVVEDFDFGRYDSFEESLEVFLKAIGASQQKIKKGELIETAIGKTMWGAVNKVEMMRAALTFEGLELEGLRWGFAKALNEMADFIERTSQS